jgi:hypothetical protein
MCQCHLRLIGRSFPTLSLGGTRLSDLASLSINNLALDLIPVLSPLFGRRGWFAYVSLVSVKNCQTMRLLTKA